MVFSVRSDRPFITSKPLKKAHKMTEHEKKMREFAETHRVYVEASPTGETVVRAVKIDE